MDQESAIPHPTPEELSAEIDRFEVEAKKFLDGEANPDAFKRFRLKQGIYGQRQPGVQMVRIKIPFGALTAEQARAIARISEEYATGVCHVTTRQDIQLHFVKLERVPALLRELAAVGLTTREACGNTVRNVTACPLAGVCPDELFDVTPYALATSGFFLRHPICEDLPRKFKIAFSGCAHDRAMTGIHDVGVTAAAGPGDELGFKITVGGGLGPSPKRPYLLEEFILPADLLPVCEAVLRVFSRFGNRKNRSLARIKFLLEKIGFEEFYRLYAEERQVIGQSRPQVLPEPLRTVVRPVRTAPVAFSVAGGSAGESENGDLEWRRWRARSVIEQRQPGLCAVQIRLTIGDLSAAGLRAVADLADRFAHGRLRTTQQQNLVFRDVEEASLPALYRALSAAGGEQGLAAVGAEELADVVACPGTDSCGLGITASKGLGRVLAERLALEGDQDERIRRITVKVSGCPNSCAQHHIAAIGFHGVAHKINGRLLPAYQLHLGGRTGNGNVQFGQLFGLKFPAKRVPEVVQRLLALYRAERHNGESFLEYADRLTKARVQQELAPLAQAADEAIFHDWEDEGDYALTDHGPGECGSVAVNFVAQHFEDSAYELAHARVLLQKTRPLDAVTRADLALVASAKALLTMDEVEPLTYDEALKAFEARVIAQGRLPRPLWTAVDEPRRRRAAQPLTMAAARQYVHAVGELAAAAQAYYEQIAGQPVGAQAQDAPPESPGG
ncbi:MAG: nitrite/sulfite reductase [Nitrospirota bacterium]